MIRPEPLPVRCPLPGPFATATAVRPAAAGQWSASIHPGWDIAGNANGGYLLAVAARALAGATGRPDPVTVTAHYLSPGRPGSVRIAAQTHEVQTENLPVSRAPTPTRFLVANAFVRLEPAE